MKVQASAIINRPPETVFRFAWVDHLKNHPRWDPNVISIEPLTEGPMRAGARFQLTRRMMGKVRTEIREVLEWEPPHRIVVRAESPGFDLRFTSTCEPAGDGGTRLVLVGDAHASGLRGMLMPLMKRRLERGLADGTNRIKMLIEDETRTG